MTEGQAQNTVWLVLVLVLVLSSFAVRRVSMSLVLRAALGWGAIAAVIFIVMINRAQLGAMLAGVGEAIGITEQRTEGRTVRIAMNPDGHFWARATINGVSTRMLIDSGATITALSERTAAAAGVRPDDSGYPVMLDTANGLIAAKRANIQHLALGPLETEDLSAVVSANFGDQDMLGMNFLSRLGSWRVEGQTLVLEPAKTKE